MVWAGLEINGGTTLENNYGLFPEKECTLKDTCKRTYMKKYINCIPCRLMTPWDRSLVRHTVLHKDVCLLLRWASTHFVEWETYCMDDLL